MLKIGLSAITGTVKGIYSKDGSYIKRGVSKNGNKYQIFELPVSSKDMEGNWTNGQSIKVMLSGDKKVEEKQAIGLVGRFQPDNYTNKDGKEIRGMKFVANVEDLFTPDNWEKKQEEPAKPKKAAYVEEEDNVWA